MSAWYCEKRAIDAIPVNDRGALYGDGLFETVALRGGVPRFWSMHLERLRYGCERLAIPPPAPTMLRDELESAITVSGIDTSHAIAKIIVSAGTGPRGYRRPEPAGNVVRIGIFAASPLPATAYRDGVRVRICNTRLAVQPQLAGIKTLNRLEQVLARAEWNTPEIAEGLLRDTDDRLICGTMSNVFVVTSRTLATPAITRCGVAGIMRRHLLTLLDVAGIPCEVRDVGTGELEFADEVFLCNSQFGILPVVSCDKRNWPVGSITRQAMSLAASSQVEECAL